ncbi:MAG: hypothetical protein F6K37_05050 [Moorea sp. SIO4E2]|nr:MULTISPECIES: hypothetical protein [Moorena]NEP67955.1 hypothetical protein [Moorena sp. SIO3A5]NEQ05355.1 hypothetical protein [Moorena sp. SIO4E2]OLT65847.1 hypothetical protein BI334_13105 [Moorena producens 3L]
MIGGHMYYIDYMPTLRHNHNLPTLLPVDFDQIVGWANGHDWYTNGITLMICPPYAWEQGTGNYQHVTYYISSRVGKWT